MVLGELVAGVTGDDLGVRGCKTIIAKYQKGKFTKGQNKELTSFQRLAFQIIKAFKKCDKR